MGCSIPFGAIRIGSVSDLDSSIPPKAIATVGVEFRHLMPSETLNVIDVLGLTDLMHTTEAQHTFGDNFKGFALLFHCS